jgi:GNAT superfamily N-acetyltransferase
MGTGLDVAKEYNLRLATLSDIPQLRLLIDASVRRLHTEYYTPAQISAALKSVYGVDTQLIIDGNYYVVETESPPRTPSHYPPRPLPIPTPRIIACGGWSHRSTLYGGDQYNSRDDNLLDPSKDAAKIRAFFVHPDWTRRGIGGIVLKACEDAARKAGFRTAEMGATLSGVPFYGTMGYAEIGAGLVKVPVGEGILLEIVRMGKALI